MARSEFLQKIWMRTSQKDILVGAVLVLSSCAAFHLLLNKVILAPPGIKEIQMLPILASYMGAFVLIAVSILYFEKE
tara:strand:+ start:1054 stop:1284 length:231 start_codon:yes stop_codon:yes gene_type:complete